MSTYTVIRSKWYRGQGADDSCLLREADGMSCCLGFVGSQCGISDNDMQEVVAPCDIWDRGNWPEWMKPKEGKENHSRDCMRAMQINDSEVIRDADREAQLSAIFERNGDRVEFVD